MPEVTLMTDYALYTVKGHVAFEADQTPFGNYDAGLVKPVSPTIPAYTSYC